MVGNDAMNTPPAHALARRGIIDNARGYMFYGDYTKPNPPAAIVDAVDNGDIDVAVVWRPLAGYFADGAARPDGRGPGEHRNRARNDKRAALQVWRDLRAA